MGSKLQYLASVFNLTICTILLFNTFYELDYYRHFDPHSTILNLLRGTFAQFVLLSEFKSLKPHYVGNFKAFMFPKGRAICYFMFALACFNITWYGIFSFITIFIIGIFTLCCKPSDPSQSPYLDPLDENNANLNPNHSPVPPHRQAAFYNQYSASVGAFSTNSQPMAAKQPQQYT